VCGLLKSFSKGGLLCEIDFRKFNKVQRIRRRLVKKSSQLVAVRDDLLQKKQILIGDGLQEGNRTYSELFNTRRVFSFSERGVKERESIS